MILKISSSFKFLFPERLFVSCTVIILGIRSFNGKAYMVENLPAKDVGISAAAAAASLDAESEERPER